ncbi:MAG: hypothetical protein MJZ26_13760 [Fibrobacter sp.]|nr:hypothetical protein [Fibrobacter sp.]
MSAVAFALFAFNACGDDSGSTSASGENSSLSSAVEDDESSSSINGDSSSSVIPGSSSSVILSDSEGSSSSVKGSDTADMSSSSIISDPDRESSSSSEKSSSSSAKSSSSVNSSSSVKSSSSSSAKSSSSAASSSSGDYVPYDHWAVLGPRRADSVFKQFVDTRNNRSYYYLTIYNKDHSDSLTVFAENLNIGEMVDGSENQSDNDKIERYCYDNDTTNCDRYGGLYQWAEMMGFNDSCNTKSCAHLIDENHQGICPKDWRIITAEDIKFILNSEYVMHGFEDMVTQNGFVGYNTTGFSLVPSGMRRDPLGGGGFNLLTYSAYWFYPEEKIVDGYHVGKDGIVNSSGLTSNVLLKTYGVSVRCVKVYQE